MKFKDVEKARELCWSLKRRRETLALMRTPSCGLTLGPAPASGGWSSPAVTIGTDDAEFQALFSAFERSTIADIARLEGELKALGIEE